MDSAELRSALQDAGLSQYQAEAYTALLQLGAASATELADACSVPTARIYDVLRDLESKGYIDTYEQDSLQASARDPDEVLEDLRGRAELLAEAAEEIETRWEQPEVDQHRVSIVKRFDTVFERARELIHGADNDVQVAVDPAGYERLRDACAAAHDNGVVVKVAIVTDVDAVTPDIDFEGEVTEARHRRLPTPFTVLVDRSHTCFAPHRDSLNQYGVLVDDYTLTYVFHWYFLTCLWEVWEQLYSARSQEPSAEYVDVRQFVRDVEPLLDAGEAVRVTVTGYRTGSGEPATVSGVVEDIAYEGSSGDGEPALSQLAGKVTLTLGTDEGEVTVGGWGAVLEDLEATRVTVETVEAHRTRVQ